MKKIKSVIVNNRRKEVEIETSDKKKLSLPFARLDLQPTRIDPIDRIYIDGELGKQGVTYVLKSGKEDSLLLDSFLDYNKDPDYLKDILLYKMTLEALNQMRTSLISKNEITRRLNTSPSQLARLLDPKNKKKSLDNMLRLLTVLGCDVELKIKAA